MIKVDVVKKLVNWGKVVVGGYGRHVEVRVAFRDARYGGVRGRGAHGYGQYGGMEELHVPGRSWVDLLVLYNVG